ncbi:MAG: type III-B CRISPR module RAMP protein Cmr6 [Methanosarcina sp.]|jgi:CRISPR-associated protein Cmr6
MKSKSKSTYFNSNGKKRPENNSRKNRRNNEYFEYILPSDTRKLIEENIGSIDNYALKLNKASPFDYKDEKFKFFEKDKKDVLINIEPNFSGINFSALSDRYRDSLKKLGLEVKSGIYKIDWKLAIGLGNESVYETAIALHHIYGIPYISGSALKGVVRSYIILENFSKNENGDIDLKNAEARALKDQGFCDLFGCPKESFYGESRQGKVIFFDALPLSEPIIEPEIMNPHYSEYYSDNSNTVPPADYHDPKPIFFLIVKDMKFEFTVGSKNTNLLSVAYDCMSKALKEHGIGAKTSVGYGYFEENIDLESTIKNV